MARFLALCAPCCASACFSLNCSISFLVIVPASPLVFRIKVPCVFLRVSSYPIFLFLGVYCHGNHTLQTILSESLPSTEVGKASRIPLVLSSRRAKVWRESSLQSIHLSFYHRISGRVRVTIIRANTTYCTWNPSHTWGKARRRIQRINSGASLFL